MKSLKEILESEKYPMIKLVDKENKEIEVEDIDSSIYDYTPVLNVEHLFAGTIYKVTLDAFQRDGHVYCKRNEIGLDRIYESKTAGFLTHLLVIDKDGQEELCW